MSAKNTTKEKNTEQETVEDKERICFVVMPISDQEGYPTGHFDRVYLHLIKPAIEKAGLEARRADEETLTNDIRLDIIKKILESEHVICDLSARNANVFYELGMRQAFDKSVTLIKDVQTPRVFDVAGIRTIQYDENLRIDNIEPKVLEIAASIEKTILHSDKDSFENSIIKHLGITAAEPAKTTEISSDTQLILEKLRQLEKMNPSNQSLQINHKRETPVLLIHKKYSDNKITGFSIGDKAFDIGTHLYRNGIEIGEITSIQGEYLFTKIDRPGTNQVEKIIQISDIVSNLSEYVILPF
ncbi:hypothetical protein [Myroides fluvii]|uniref:hypothetical protein n=1 Tax=Myroides fluvii TaxID=2572594 RepID=UPI00131D8C79|nr:hypothetical protein [Myroides fluvii]